MSIERNLKSEYERNSSLIKCPPSLDSRIMAVFNGFVMEQRGKRDLLRKWKLPRAAWIAVIAVVVLCGFAYAGSKLLFEEQKGNFAIRMDASESVELEKADVEKIRDTLKEVKTQLSAGESAVVYLADYEAKFTRMPLLAVTNAVMEREIQDWKAILKYHHAPDNIPESIFGTYQFVGGMKAPPYGAFVDMDTVQLLDEMKAESRKTGNDVIWRKYTATADPIPAYTSIYRNPEQATIYFSLQMVSDVPIRMEVTTSASSVYEELNLNGNKAHFTRTEQALYGDSNIYQDITWMNEDGERTLIYQVGSDSSSVTKEQLVQAARSMQ
jgi:hypothetical protein